MTSLPREGYIIHYDYRIGGHTLNEWLIYWAWQYFISSIDVVEYVQRIDYITVDMPGVFDEARWKAHTDYLEVLSKQ